MHSVNQKTSGLIALLMIVLFTGCGTTAKFVYPAKMDDLVKFSTPLAADKKVAVMPFDDCREADNATGAAGLCYVPLFPCGWVTYDRPDAARMFETIYEFEFTPSEDLPKAAAVSLRKSGLFKDAFFTYGGEADNADFVLCGEIKSTRYVGSTWTYGLSIAGSTLWIFGLPIGSSKCELTLVFTLKKKGQTIWEYAFDRSDRVWQSFYYQWGRDGVDYAELMQQAMNEALTDMAKKFRAHPDLLR